MKKVHVKDETKKGFKYKIIPTSENTVITDDIDIVFDTLEEAMLAVESYVATNRIFSGAVRIKEISVN